MADRYLIIIMTGPGGNNSGEGQLPEPDNVKQFVNHMNSYGVQPLIYMIDPIFDDKYIIESDRNKFEMYPNNVYKLAMTLEAFVLALPQIQNTPYPVFIIDNIGYPSGYVLFFDLKLNILNSNINYLISGCIARKHNMFSVLTSDYDINTNRYHRIVYDPRSGNKIPSNLQPGDKEYIVNLFSKAESYIRGNMLTPKPTWLQRDKLTMNILVGDTSNLSVDEVANRLVPIVQTFKYNNV